MENHADTPYVPAALERVHLRLALPSRPDWIEPTVEYLKNQAVLCGACLDSQAHRLVLALHEALSNSVVHGNLEVSSDLKETSDDAFAAVLAARAADPHFAARSVEVLVDYDGEQCSWTITDQGQGFNVEAVLQRDPFDEAALLRASGRGILMMRALLDDVRYEAGGRRVILTARKVSDEEYRRYPRHPVQKPIQVMPIRDDGSIDWDAAYDAVSRNLSLEGMAILQNHLTTTGRILIAVPGSGQPVYLPAEVCHVRPVGKEMVEVGCRFQAKARPVPAAGANAPAPLGDEAVTGLIERLRSQEVVRQEQRTHTRFIYTERISVKGKGGEPDVGFARDLSKSGIAFVTTGPLSLEVVTLSLPQGSQSPLRVRAQVVRCVKIMEGFYDVGARFLGPEMKSHPT